LPPGAQGQGGGPCRCEYQKNGTDQSDEIGWAHFEYDSAQHALEHQSKDEPNSDTDHQETGDSGGNFVDNAPGGGAERHADSNFAAVGSHNKSDEAIKAD